MRSRSVTVAIALSLLAGTAAVVAHVQARRLRSDARWLMERVGAQAEEYSDTLDTQVAEGELATLDQRHAVLDRAELWQRVELLSILCAVVGGFSSYALYLMRRLREQLVDAAAHLDEHDRASASPQRS